MTNLRARIIAGILVTGYENETRQAIDATRAIEYEYGEGANRSNFLFEFTGAITTSATHTYTLDDATQLFDAFGDGIDAAQVKAVVLINTGNTELTIGGSVDGVSASTVKAGAVYMVATPSIVGYAMVVDSAGYRLTVVNKSGSAAGSYSLVIIGELA